MPTLCPPGFTPADSFYPSPMRSGIAWVENSLYSVGTSPGKLLDVGEWDSLANVAEL